MARARAVVATRNQAKLRELAEILTSLELLPLPDEVELPPEVGETFADNALAKARAERQRTVIPPRPNTRTQTPAANGATDYSLPLPSRPVQDAPPGSRANWPSQRPSNSRSAPSSPT